MPKLYMSSRGVSHIEAILSFILFAGFIFVALYFFIPSGNVQIADSTLQYALNAISANTSVELQSYSVRIYQDQVPSQNRGVVAVEFPIEITTLPANYVAKAETYEGRDLDALKSGNTVYVDTDGEEFVIIKLSEDIIQGNIPSVQPQSNPLEYRVASSSIRKVISEKRALELNKSYYESYENLKNSLSIPRQSSFGFSMQFSEYEIRVPTVVPQGVEVFSTLTRREMLTTEGDSAFAEINVRIW